MNMGSDPKSLFGYQTALSKVENFLSNHWTTQDIRKETGQSYVRYTIIQLIRLCLQFNSKNKRSIYKFVNTIVNDEKLRDGLRFYTASKKDSKILPILIKLKFSWLIILACRYRANKRHNKK